MRVLIALLILLALGPSVQADDVAALRAGGQASVDHLHASNADDVLLDAVCAQRDCRASRLFWYTDLEEAKRAAAESGKPIISLRLLGRLDEEVSCANSRFFRVLLYSDPAIAKLLRERFVLHWSSVRPVPVITIDVGNGRTIRQTITGNSVHYLMNDDGRVFDVLPGLYSPQAFRTYLERWSSLTIKTVRDYRDERLRETAAQWDKLGLTTLVRTRPERLTAEEAAQRAMSKVAIEKAFFTAMSLGATLRVVEPQEWRTIGAATAESVEFSPESLALMGTKQKVTPLMLQNLRQTVAMDTAYNELDLHRRALLWLNMGQTNLETLNRRIYAELFLSPVDDPWMGLKAPSVFTALKE